MQRQVPALRGTEKTIEVPCSSSTEWWTIPQSCRGRPPPVRREMTKIVQRVRARDAAGSTRQADEVSGATPLGEVDHAKTRSKAFAQDLDQSPQDQNADASDLEHFQDLVLPSSQSYLERETLCVSSASNDEGRDEAGDGCTEGWVEVKKRGKKNGTKKSMASIDEEKKNR